MPREQHDGLTGALTRARLNSRLLQEQQRSARNGGGFALLMVDLDYFKSINDAFGHQRGDQLLVEVVQRIKGAVRQSDQVYRYGGDEFIVLFPNTQPEQAHQLAARVFQQLTSRPYPGSPPVSVTASIGVAAYPSDATTIPNLFEVLDQRHYQGKAYGRGRIVSTNLAPVGGSGPAAPDRLIERDPALQETQRFLRRLPEKRLGALHITGEPQVGRTRFLDEVCKIARLQGYAVLSMRGAPALSARRLGSWMDAQHPWEALKDLHSLSLPAALQQIDQYITRKGLAGLLIAVDNLALVDPPSLELLYGLLAAGPAFVIGLAVTHLPGQLEKLTRLDLDLESRAALQPLSPGGVQIWLRHSLHWEAPAAWVAWLHLHSGGLPGRLHFAIEWLVSHELLDRRAPSAFPPGEQAGERLIEAARQARRAAPELEAFFGREQETEQIKRLLAHSRLVTISGPGGMGKSRLARQAATEWAQDSAQPVCWVRLDHSQDRNQALTAIAAGLGLILQPGDELEQLQKHLQRRKLLLVLDGFERLLDCTHLLDQLTQDAPQVRLLVTSLLPLNLPAEQVIRLQGLPAGQAAAGPGAAVELFVHSARRARPTFDPPPAELQHIGRICQALGGSPLGIQLAAAWVSSFNCAQILDQVLGSDSLPSQHDDERLSSVLDNLWQLLAPSEQHTIAALAVFHGGFTREAAWQVAGASVFMLDALASKAVIQPVDGPRFSLPRLTHRYAGRRLAELPGLLDQAARRHAVYFARLCANARPRLYTGQQPAVLCELGSEIDNLRRAWDWAIAARDLACLEQLLLCLQTFFTHQGWFREAGQRLEQMIAVLQCPAAAGSGEDNSPLPGLLLGRALTALGELDYHRGYFAHGVQQLDQALQQLQAADRRLQMEFLNSLGVVAYYRSDYRQAHEFFEEALQAARQIDSPGRAVAFLNNLGNTSLKLGNLAAARVYLLDSLAACRQQDMLTLRSSIYESLGQVELAAGDLEQAAERFRLGLETIQGLDAAPMAAELFAGVAELWERQERPAEAVWLARWIQAQPLALQHSTVRAARLIERLSAGRMAASAGLNHAAPIDGSLAAAVAWVIAGLSPGAADQPPLRLPEPLISSQEASAA